MGAVIIGRSSVDIRKAPKIVHIFDEKAKNPEMCDFNLISLAL